MTTGRTPRERGRRYLERARSTTSRRTPLWRAPTGARPRLHKELACGFRRWWSRVTSPARSCPLAQTARAVHRAAVAGLLASRGPASSARLVPAPWRVGGSRLRARRGLGAVAARQLRAARAAGWAVTQAAPQGRRLRPASSGLGTRRSPRRARASGAHRSRRLRGPPRASVAASLRPRRATRRWRRCRRPGRCRPARRRP